MNVERHELGAQSAAHDEDRSWAIQHGGEDAGRGWDDWHREHDPPGTWESPEEATTIIAKLTAERDAALARANAAEIDAKAWKSQLELYSNAWQCALGNKLFKKSHLIDALVKTTVYLQENFDTWAHETAAIREQRETAELAAMLGVNHKDFGYG